MFPVCCVKDEPFAKFARKRDLLSGRVVVPGKPMASQVQIPFEGVILQEHSVPISCPTPNFAKGWDVTGLYHSPEALAREDALAGTGCGRDARAPRQCRMRWGVEALPLSSGEREVRSKLGKGRGRYGFRSSERAFWLSFVSFAGRPEPGPTLPTRGRGPMRKRSGTGGTWGGSSGLGPCRRFPGSASAETHPAIDGRP